MQPRDYVLEQIRHHQTPIVPYTLGVDQEVAVRLDAHYGNAEWRKLQSPYFTFVQAVETDAREPLDSSHNRDPYGCIWRTDCRPFHLENAPLSRPSFEGYRFPKAEQFYRPELKAKALQTCRDNPGRFLVCSGIGWGIFERSWNLRGMENVLMDCIEEPDFFDELIERLAQVHLGCVQYMADLPVDAIMFGDDWGDQRSVTLGVERWRKFIKPRWARIYEAVHAAGKVALHHCCGSVVEIMPDLIEIGLDVLESVQPEAAGMNPYELKRHWGDKITFWGCLGSQSTIPFSTPREIKAEVARLCREMGRGGGYLLAPSKSLQPETPTQNAVAVLEAFSQQVA